MAIRAYLLAVNDSRTTWSQNPEEEIIAEGISGFPVFWCSLFSHRDLHLDTVDVSDGHVQVRNWCVDSRVAKKRLAALSSAISRLLDKRSKTIWRSWIHHVTTFRDDANYFKINAVEVWNAIPGTYDAYMTTMLDAFSIPSAASMAAAVNANGLDYVDGAVIWENEIDTICQLAGGDHVRAVPWWPKRGADRYSPKPQNNATECTVASELVTEFKALQPLAVNHFFRSVGAPIDATRSWITGEFEHFAHALVGADWTWGVVKHKAWKQRDAWILEAFRTDPDSFRFHKHDAVTDPCRSIYQTRIKPLLPDGTDEYRDYSNPDAFYLGELLDMVLERWLVERGMTPTLWSEIMNAYVAGYLPCGWVGDYPAGHLIVY